MATQKLLIVNSDLSGEPEATPVKLALFGTDYELDLTAGELEQLETLLQPYLTVARRIGGRRTRSVGGATAGSGRAQAKSAANSGTIRAWARAHGYEISERGRVPMTVQEAYLAAQNNAAQNSAAQNGAAEKAATRPARSRKAAATGPESAPTERVRGRARKASTA